MKTPDKPPYKFEILPILWQPTAIVAGVVGLLGFSVMRWDLYPLALLQLIATFHCATVCSVLLRDLRHQKIGEAILAHRLNVDRLNLERQIRSIEQKLDLLLSIPDPDGRPL